MTSETIQRLSAALHAGAELVAPIYQGHRGHPVGFAATWGAELQQLQGDAGARQLIAAHALATYQFKVAFLDMAATIGDVCGWVR